MFVEACEFEGFDGRRLRCPPQAPQVFARLECNRGMVEPPSAAVGEARPDGDRGALTVHIAFAPHRELDEFELSG